MVGAGSRELFAARFTMPSMLERTSDRVESTLPFLSPSSLLLWWWSFEQALLYNSKAAAVFAGPLPVCLRNRRWNTRDILCRDRLTLFLCKVALEASKSRLRSFIPRGRDCRHWRNPHFYEGDPRSRRTGRDFSSSATGFPGLAFSLDATRYSRACRPCPATSCEFVGHL